jgi:DNA polymerase sigma
MKTTSTSSIKTSSTTGTTDEFSSSTSYPSSSAASCISSDDNHSSSNHTSDIDDDHFSHHASHTCKPSNTVEHVNLAHMLISFLELYGVYFNYAKLGIRVQTPHQSDRPAGFIDKEELFKNFCCGHRTINNLSIVDPFNDSMYTVQTSAPLDRFLSTVENDISKASWLTPKLNSAFREAYDKLLQSVSEQNTTLKNAPSYVTSHLELSVDDTFLFF